MSNSLNGKSITGAQIYDGGNLTPIAAEDLKGNLVAIKQLINNFNEKTKKLEQVEEDLSSFRNELEFQNTYPYVAIFAAVASIIGTVLVGIGVNMITGTGTDASWISIVVLILGGLLVLTANIFTILYRWVRGWFNKTQKGNPKGQEEAR